MSVFERFRNAMPGRGSARNGKFYLLPFLSLQAAGLLILWLAGTIQVGGMGPHWLSFTLHADKNSQALMFQKMKIIRPPNNKQKRRFICTIERAESTSSADIGYNHE